MYARFFGIMVIVTPLKKYLLACRFSVEHLLGSIVFFFILKEDEGANLVYLRSIIFIKIVIVFFLF